MGLPRGDFKTWVQNNKPSADFIGVSKLRTKTVVEVVSCEPQTISKAFAEVEQMMESLGISRGGVLIPEECSRMAVCDEKGFSSRSDNQSRAVVTRRMRGKASTTSATCSFTHITVTSFMPLNGPCLPCGVIVPFKQVNKHFEDLWPGARFYAHETGSQTPLTFPAMLEECFLIPMRERWPDKGKRLLLWLDSGGGSMLHLTVSTALLCHRYACDIYLIPPYGTKALCALDQQPHAWMSKQWSAFKQEFSRQSNADLGIFPAIRALNFICSEALNEKNSLAGWSHCGIIPGEAVQRNKVLVDRFTECFQSKKAGGGLSETPTSKAAGALDLVQKISPKKERCTAPACKNVFSVAFQHCPACGAKNDNFVEKELVLHGGGKKPGWAKSISGLTSFSALLFLVLIDSSCILIPNRK